MSEKPANLYSTPIKGPQEFATHFAVSHETMERLKIYAELLGSWQKAQNLVAPATLSTLWHRHMADSAQLISLLEKSDAGFENFKTAVDFGSGAGFPGLVVAILLADKCDMRMHLIESNGRKCAFLREVARKTAISVEICNERIETFADSGKISQVDLIMARALAPLDDLLPLSAPIFQKQTRAFFLKGKGAEAEIDKARAAWWFTVELHPSQTDAEGRILEISQIFPA